MLDMEYCSGRGCHLSAGHEAQCVQRELKFRRGANPNGGNILPLTAPAELQADHAVACIHISMLPLRPAPKEPYFNYASGRQRIALGEVAGETWQKSQETLPGKELPRASYHLMNTDAEY